MNKVFLASLQLTVKFSIIELSLPSFKIKTTLLMVVPLEVIVKGMSISNTLSLIFPRIIVSSSEILAFSRIVPFSEK